MLSKINRREFLKKSALTGVSLGMVSGVAAKSSFSDLSATDVRVGIIGLDTSHSPAFTRIINNPELESMRGYRVTAAYPYGSRTIESSYSRIPKFIEDMKNLDVDIADSVQSLLDSVDVVLLETNDGNLHLEQALQVFEAGKPVFIDKPAAGNLSDTIAIFKAAEEYNVPVFSSSSLRWSRNSHQLRDGEVVGRVLGASTYSPARIEPSHIDLAWYGIHGVESLFTVMGTGCKKVVRISNPDTDIVVGTWDEDRMGTFRGIRKGRAGYGGTAFGESGISEIGPYEGYQGIVEAIVEFFRTGIPPVSAEETIEIFAFMEAADVSKRRGGQPVLLQEVINIAQ